MDCNEIAKDIVMIEEITFGLGKNLTCFAGRYQISSSVLTGLEAGPCPC